MKTAALALTLVSTAAVAQSDAAVFEARDVRMFERISLGDDVSLIAFGVMEDSRCAKPRLCFEDDRLVIDTMMVSRGIEREFPMELGVRYRLPGGTLMLADTSTPASENGAIALKHYRLDFVYDRTPNR